MDANVKTVIDIANITVALNNFAGMSPPIV